MNGTKYIELAKRDAEVIFALSLTLEALRLTHGARIIINSVSGHLNFEQQMLAMRGALAILGVDPDEFTSPNE